MISSCTSAALQRITGAVDGTWPRTRAGLHRGSAPRGAGKAPPGERVASASRRFAFRSPRPRCSLWSLAGVWTMPSLSEPRGGHRNSSRVHACRRAIPGGGARRDRLHGPAQAGTASGQRCAAHTAATTSTRPARSSSASSASRSTRSALRCRGELPGAWLGKRAARLGVHYALARGHRLGVLFTQALGRGRGRPLAAGAGLGCRFALRHRSILPPA